MNASRTVILALLALVVLAVLVIGVWVTHGDSSTDPGSAKTCEELVNRSAKVVRKIVTDLGTKTREDLEADDPNNPFRSLEEPFASFSSRAQTLQCDQTELRRLACDAYAGVEPQGPVAREFLADFVQNCR